MAAGSDSRWAAVAIASGCVCVCLSVCECEWSVSLSLLSPGQLHLCSLDTSAGTSSRPLLPPALGPADAALTPAGLHVRHRRYGGLAGGAHDGRHPCPEAVLGEGAHAVHLGGCHNLSRAAAARSACAAALHCTALHAAEARAPERRCRLWLPRCPVGSSGTRPRLQCPAHRFPPGRRHRARALLALRPGGATCRTRGSGPARRATPFSPPCRILCATGTARTCGKVPAGAGHDR
jgi:hypothetical protein